MCSCVSDDTLGRVAKWRWLMCAKKKANRVSRLSPKAFGHAVPKDWGQRQGQEQMKEQVMRKS